MNIIHTAAAIVIALGASQASAEAHDCQNARSCERAATQDCEVLQVAGLRHSCSLDVGTHVVDCTHGMVAHCDFAGEAWHLVQGFALDSYCQ